MHFVDHHPLKVVHVDGQNNKSPWKFILLEYKHYHVIKLELRITVFNNYLL